MVGLKTSYKKHLIKKLKELCEAWPQLKNLAIMPSNRNTASTYRLSKDGMPKEFIVDEVGDGKIYYRVLFKDSGIAGAEEFTIDIRLDKPLQSFIKLGVLSSLRNSLRTPVKKSIVELAVEKTKATIPMNYKGSSYLSNGYASILHELGVKHVQKNVINIPAMSEEFIWLAAITTDKGDPVLIRVSEDCTTYKTLFLKIGASTLHSHFSLKGVASQRIGLWVDKYKHFREDSEDVILSRQQVKALKKIFGSKQIYVYRLGRKEGKNWLKFKYDDLEVLVKGI